MPFKYKTIATGSNFVPIGIDIKRDGVPLPALGVEVYVNARDRDSKEVIVSEARARMHPTIVGRWEYYWDKALVDSIVGRHVWLVEWHIRVGGYAWRLAEPAEQSVRGKIIS